MKEDELPFLIAASRRILAREAFESRVAGHVPAREPGEDAFWVSPFGYFDETTPEMVIKVDFDLNRLHGDWEPSPAIEFHAARYRARPDVNSVIHTHSHWLSKFVTRAIPIGQYNVAAEAIGGTEFPPEEVVCGKMRSRQFFLPQMWSANDRRLRTSDPDLFEDVD